MRRRTMDYIELNKNRPSHFQGKIDIDGGRKYDFGSGGRGRGSIPYGMFDILGLHKASQYPSFVNNSFEIADMYDPKLDDERGAILIHAGSGDIGEIESSGCIAVAQSQWSQFKKDLLAFLEKGAAIVYVDSSNDAHIIPKNGTWNKTDNKL